MNAIILAAGFGDRLKPITDFVPKPLLPIVNRPIIEINIARLLRLGIEKIGINLFHKSALIKKFLEKSSDPVYVVTEDTLKGTGGALLNFREFVGENFIIHNSDVLTDLDLAEAINFHNTHKPIATLILTKNRGTNFVRIDNKTRIKEFRLKDNDDFYTFTGIAIVSDKIFSYLPKRDNFSIIEVYKSIIDDGKPVLAIIRAGLWYDIGSHNGYWKAHHDILNRKVEFNDMKINSCRFIDSTSDVRTKNLNGFIAIGPHCFVAETVSLSNTVVFGHSRILKGNYKNCLLSDQFCIEIDTKERKHGV